jgi:hypothetical protein
MQKAQSKSDGQPPFKPVLSGPALAALRVDAIAIKRRTRHSAILELILSVWLNNDSGLVDVEHVAEFLRLLRQHQLECAKSVYFVLCKRIRPVSFALFKFLYFCITRYLPAHKSTLLDAYRDVMTKLNLLPSPNGKHSPFLSSASSKTAATPSIEWKGKPITRPPSIANITDIATAVGKFYDEFRAYKREHTATNCHSRTVFQCLSCEQQASFSAMCMTDEATLDAMDDAAFFELWKTHFGLRSSAAVLQAVRALQFVGDPLIPASWTDFHRTFAVTVAQAPAPLVPPLKTLAKFFVMACPDAFLRNDVLSNEPASVPEALQLVIGRLNDSGFLRSALAHARTRHAERAPQHQVQGQPQGLPPPLRKFGGNGGGPAGGGPAVPSARPAGPQDQRPRDNPRPPPTSELRPSAPQTIGPRPVRAAAEIVCKRCRKAGHSENSCISKHDVDGQKLERQDPETYAKRKDQARLEASTRVKVQAVCDDSDSDTEDLGDVADELANVALVHDDGKDDLDGIFSVFVEDIADYVPAPPLLRCGDVESNPGPFAVTRPPRKRSARRRCAPRMAPLNLEMTAPCVPRFQIVPGSFRTVRVYQHLAMPVFPAFCLLAYIALLILWHFTKPDDDAIKQRPYPPRVTWCSMWCHHFDTPHSSTDDVLPRNHLDSYAACDKWCSLYDEHVPPPSLLLDGDVEPNPGPIHNVSLMPALASDSDTSDSDTTRTPRQTTSHVHAATATRPTSIHLSPSSRRKPAKSIPASFFSPLSSSSASASSAASTSNPATVAAAAQIPHVPFTPTRPPDMPALASDSDSSDSDDAAITWNAIQAVFGTSSDSDTSDLEDAPAVASVSSTLPADGMLSPPKFNAFLVPVGSSNPPPLSSAQVCAIDTMCQGQYSVISKDLTTRLNLPTKPCNINARTASGAVVTCTSIATFAVTVFVVGAWISLPTQALIWDKTAEPILLSNSFALSTGLIDFVKPNAERVPTFGQAAFAHHWKQVVASHEASVLAAYHEDVMPEETDDFIDLDAPLRCGDQDISGLPPDAMAYAKRYPEMTRAIPRDAHPSLDRWEAHVQQDKIPNYSWPKADLKDLKEEPLPFAYTPLLHKEFDKLISMHYAEEVTSCPTAVAMRAQLVFKSKTEKRFCVNGSTQKNI